MIRAWRMLAVLVFAVSLTLPREVHAEEVRTTASFALIIGSNASVDQELTPLKYADDDASRYLDLFRLLGARTYLLSRLDENTRRLHPQAAAEALEPKRASLDRALAQLAADVAQARDRGIETVAYVIYAGHGNVQNGQGYITLEDARITGPELAQIVAKIPSARVHVIVDACASYFLAYSRGPGGERRPLQGFQDVPQLANDPRVGLLLSTSSRRESHEWDAFQGGVFSHEVRSGLYGAADADGDGQVSYREIAAFVTRANAAVPNDKYRPDMHSRSPRGSETLVDLRVALKRKLIVDGAHASHYFLEDGRGVRLADFHNASGHALSVIRPAPSGPVYLRRVKDDAEFSLPAAPEEVLVAELTPSTPRAQARGAAQDAFDMLFTLPFDQKTVVAYREPEVGADVPPKPSSPPNLRRVLGVTTVGVGLAGVGLGMYFLSSASREADGAGPNESQAAVAQRNQRIANANMGAVIASGLGGGAIVGGLAILLWPTARVQGTASADGMLLQYGDSF